MLLIAIPTATAVALGGTSIVSSWRSAVANQRSETLASMSTKVTQLAYHIEAERDAIVWYIAAGDLGRTALTIGHVKKGDKIAAEGQLQIVNQQFVYTNPDVTTVKDGMAEIGSGYPAAVQASAAGVASVLKGLAGLRNTALTTQVGASGVITEYDKVVSNLLAFDDQVGLSSSDPQLASTARAFTSISRIEDEDSIQRAIVMYGLVSGSLGSGLLNQLNGSVSEQSAEFPRSPTSRRPARFLTTTMRLPSRSRTASRPTCPSSSGTRIAQQRAGRADGLVRRHVRRDPAVARIRGVAGDLWRRPRSGAAEPGDHRRDRGRLGDLARARAVAAVHRLRRPVDGPAAAAADGPERLRWRASGCPRRSAG